MNRYPTKLNQGNTLIFIKKYFFKFITNNFESKLFHYKILFLILM